MNLTLDPKQTLYLWSLITSGGEGYLKDQAYQPAAASRGGLVAAGLLEQTRRPYPDSGRPAFHYTVTDLGWAWAAQHLDAPLPTRSSAAALVLQQLLAALKCYLQRHPLALAELLAGPAAADDTPGTDQDRVIDLARELAGGRGDVRVRLSELRRRLPEMRAETLDAALLDLQSRGRLILMRLDDPREIGPEDAAAALAIGAGELRHILYLAEG